MCEYCNKTGWIVFCPSEPDKCDGCEVTHCEDCELGFNNIGKHIPSVSEVKEMIGE